MEVETLVQETDAINVSQIFEKQMKHQFEVGRSTAKDRIGKLNRLHRAVIEYKIEIQQALYDDFKKHPSETDLTEIYCVTGEIKHAIRHLKKWMKPHRVATPIALMGSSSYIHYEPKGVVLIISPWNFPLNLTFGPLISAIAAGNCVIIKPSELTPNSSKVMKKIIEETFDGNEISIIEGGVETSTQLLELPFNHVFFTGSPAIGKVVMEAAAKNLASVTLELGGKSPTIIDETANVDMAARRIMWAKFFNNGQTCIAPDYVFVHEKVKDDYFQKSKKYLDVLYSAHPDKSESYCRIVNERHFERLKDLLDSAVEDGAQVVIGGATNGNDKYIEPTMITDVKFDSAVMKEEIFGPVLPVNSFKDIDEVTKFIRSGEKPLAIYIYSSSKKNTNKIINDTRAGTSVINHSVIHFFQNNLPFGGSNNSGIGKSHGYYGFQAFSNARGVMKQIFPISGMDMMMPPYTDLKKKLIDLTIKWF